MSERGHRRTWLQCQRKVKSLKAKYKEAKDSNQRSGRGRATCPFYEELERILGDKPSVQPLELLDSSVAVTEDEPETPESETSSAGTDADTGESLLSTSCVSGDASSPQQSTETCEKATAATKSSETKSSKSRKRKTKMETALEVFAEKIGSTFNKDDTELQLKMQAAQHAHEIRMFTLFSQFMERSHHYPHPPNYQAPVQPPKAQPPPVQPPSMQPSHLYNQIQPLPQHSHSSFTQPPPFHMASPQPLPFSHETPNHPFSFLQGLSQPLPFNQSPAHTPDSAPPFNSTCQVSAHPPFSRPSGDEES
ncbi:bromodomain-containing protein 4-like [Epinephelus fuscoguttatus]|uniref:bromodomain-containing protein 4-like n=1 Tax=Epinephelus fuscoguttatus TaxID=293821 RepID=UPI0020D155CB|nr:bromodomain-containing protein 4-like [Epinephelus fuscoguttatus]